MITAFDNSRAQERQRSDAAAAQQRQVPNDERLFANMRNAAALEPASRDLLAGLKLSIEGDPAVAFAKIAEDPIGASSRAPLGVLGDLAGLSKSYPPGNRIELYLGALGSKIAAGMYDSSLPYSDGWEKFFDREPRECEEWRKASAILRLILCEGSDAAIGATLARTLPLLDHRTERPFSEEAFNAAVNAVIASDRCFSEPFLPIVAGLLHPVFEAALTQCSETGAEIELLATVFQNGGLEARRYASPFVAQGIADNSLSSEVLGWALHAIDDEHGGRDAYAESRREVARATIRSACTILADRCITGLEEIDHHAKFESPLRILLMLATYDSGVIEWCGLPNNLHHSYGCHAHAAREVGRLLDAGKEKIFETWSARRNFASFLQDHAGARFRYGSTDFFTMLVEKLGEPAVVWVNKSLEHLEPRPSSRPGPSLR